MPPSHAAAIPSSLRKTNRRMILRHMVRVPMAARGELAVVAGTSCVTAGKIVDELLEKGVLEAADVKRHGKRPGRPEQTLRLNTQASRFVLVQLGVRHTRISFAPLGTAVDMQWEEEFETPDTAAEWDAAFRAAWARIAVSHGPGPQAQVWGVVVSMPGVVDEDHGKVLFSPNVHWSEGVDFKKMIGTTIDAPVEIVHEIHAVALGQLAALPTQKDFLIVDFGHGVGGAAVLGGGLYQGSLPLSLELGQNIVIGNDRVCGCGAIGCVETLLSRRGLFASIAEQLGKRSMRYSWSIVEKHLAQNGLEPWLRKSLQAGGAAIAGALNILGLGRVVITGVTEKMPDEIKAYLAAEIRKAAMWAKFGEVEIEYAPRRRMRGLISVGIERLVVDG